MADILKGIFLTQKKKEKLKATKAAEEAQKLMSHEHGETFADPSTGIQYPDESYHNRVKNATIDQMTISLTVWRAGSRTSNEEYYIQVSRILEPKKQKDLACNYSFAMFTQLVEEKVNNTKPGQLVKLKHGRLSYFHTGDPKFVKDNLDFEAALSQLYLSREGGDILKFLFQPESMDQKAEREAEEHAKTLLPIAEGESGEEASSAASDRQDLSVDRPRTPSKTLGKAPATPPETPAFPGDGEISPKTVPLPVRRGGTHLPRPTTRQDVRSPGSAISEGVGGSLDEDNDGNKRTSIGSKIKNIVGLGSPTKELDSKNKHWKPLEDLRDRVVAPSKVTFRRGGDDEPDEVNIEGFKASDQAVESCEADLPDDGEAEDEDTISEEDRVVAKLQSMQNLPELSQLEGINISQWGECCRMFSIDPTRTGLGEVVHLAGLKTKIYQYQAFGVYWQMVTSRKLGGGFVGDAMGLGKSLTFLALMVVERQLSCLWIEVLKSRKSNDGKHLQVLQQTTGDVCPTGSRIGWIACPCASSSPTAELAHKPGVRLACVPEPLVRSWWTQWKTHVDVTDATLNLTIVIDYAAAFDDKTPVADMNAKSSTPRNRARLEAEKSRAKDGKGDDTAKDYQDGWLVLTTARTCKKFLQQFEYPGQVRDKVDGWKSSKRPGIVFGLAMIDECHEEYFKEKGRALTLTELPSANLPFLWGYSGTPFSQTPRGLEGVLWAIEKHIPTTEKGKTGWELSEKMQQFASRQLDSLCKQFDGQVKAKKPDIVEVDSILAEFKPFLHNFLIRRRAETKWFGHTLIKLKPHIHQDLTFEWTRRLSQYDTLITEYENSFQSEKDELLVQLQQRWDQNPDTRRSNIRPTRLAFNTLCRLQWRLRLFATFPYLVKLAGAGDQKMLSTLTEEECFGFRGSPNKEKSSPYSKYLRNIVESSPKCIWLLYFLQELIQEHGIDGNEQKVVIITSFPQIAFLLKLAIQRTFPDKEDRIGLIIPRMKIKERIQEIEAFTDALDERHKRKQAKNNQLLIGTTRIIGQGLQLTRACHIVLMEPDYEFSRELQGYARVHRIGQKNPMSYSYRLIASGSEIEQRILKRQEDRGEFSGKRLAEEDLAALSAVEPDAKKSSNNDIKVEDDVDEDRAPQA